MQELNHTAILLVRNPFDAIIAHRHLDQGGHTGRAGESHFRGPGWDNFVHRKASDWLHFNRLNMYM